MLANRALLKRHPFPYTRWDNQSVAYGNGYWAACSQDGGSASPTAVLSITTDPYAGWDLRLQPSWTSRWNQKNIAYGNGWWVITGYTPDEAHPRMATCHGDPTGTWNFNPSPPTNYGTGLVYANGFWVTGGGGTSISVCAGGDPTGTWTNKATNLPTAITALAYGDGRWIVGCGAKSSAGKISTCGSDPTGTWTLRTGTIFAYGIWSIAYGNGYWVCAGEDSGFGYRTSTCGSDPTGTWTQNNTTNGVMGLIYTGTNWLGASASGYIYYCGGDPTGTWTAENKGLYLNATGVNASTSLAVANNIVVGVGIDNLGAFIGVCGLDPSGTWKKYEF